MSEKYYNYNDLEQMQEKAKKIDYETDKKNFLRTMSPLEQKMALFYSRRPYDIINYLDSLNYKETNMMLNELTNEEISKLLEQFTAEDKKNFYSTFSNSVLVNKFIANDKQAFTHIDDLNLERKIELLDSSKVSTKKATEEIYDSLSSEEKIEVESKITSTEGSLMVDNLMEIEENQLENGLLEEIPSEQTLVNEQELQNEEFEEKIQEEREERKEEKQEKKEEIQAEKFKDINNFLKIRFEQYKQQNPKFKDVDQANPDLFNSLSDELKEIVTNDFNMLTLEQKEEIKNADDILSRFKKSKEVCETEIINRMMNEEIKIQEEMINEPNEHVKTI